MGYNAWEDPRNSGRVTRWHTVPCLQNENVGEHSWQVARIVLAIWPFCPRELLVHTIIHDCGELRVGDMPSLAKAALKRKSVDFESMESEVYVSMCVPWCLPGMVILPPLQKAIFEFVEVVDGWEFALQEVEMGNRLMAPIAYERIQSLIERRGALEHTYSDDLQREGIDLYTYIQRRTAAHAYRMEACSSA